MLLLLSKDKKKPAADANKTDVVASDKDKDATNAVESKEDKPSLIFSKFNLESFLNEMLKQIMFSYLEDDSSSSGKSKKKLLYLFLTFLILKE